VNKLGDFSPVNLSFITGSIPAKKSEGQRENYFGSLQSQGVAFLFYMSTALHSHSDLTVSWSCASIAESTLQPSPSMLTLEAVHRTF
jgi:hypothetical protein